MENGNSIDVPTPKMEKAGEEDLQLLLNYILPPLLHQAYLLH